MVMFSTLRRSGGIEALARHLGLSPAETVATAQALLPHVLGAYRHRYDEAGGGHAGVAAVVELLEPFGGGNLALEILNPAPIAPERAREVLYAVLLSQKGIYTLIGLAREDGVVPVERLEAMLPLLVMLAGGYICARVQAASKNGDDIVGEFEAQFQRSGRTARR